MIEVFKHFVVFLSPGTLVSERSTHAIDEWDVEKAKEQARSIIERHGATPYAFYFMTRARDAKDLDSRELDRSCQYFLGGKVETLAEIEARNDPSESILLGNMRCHGYNRVIVNTNSFKSTMPFGDSDVILDFEVDG